MQLHFNQGNCIYVIDTSALIILDFTFNYDNLVFKAIWEEVEDLISQGHFKTINFVEDEINSYEGKQDFLKKWVKKWRKHLVIEVDSATMNATIPIINEEYQSGFFDAKKQAEGKEEADPYLIGHCIIHNHVLITNESKTKHNKIPKVAEKHGVRCIDINDFLIERGLKMERKKV
jgi:hypothetical protein